MVIKIVPTDETLIAPIDETVYYDKTYKIVTSTGSEIPDRIDGFVDDLDSIAQTIYFILNTERYRYLIYSWDYGFEVLDLYGKPIPYVMSELQRRIKEALIQDNRIEDVTDFEFERNGNKLHVSFTVLTASGTLQSETEVEV